MKFTEEQLKLYAAPLSDTENQKCLNAIGMVRDALKGLGFTDDGKSIKKMFEDTYAYSIEMRSASGGRKVSLFIQGSYANNTNVRTESDVDIAVVQEEVFNPEYRSSSDPYPQSDVDYGFSSSTPASKSFKDEVQYCLTEKFGSDVERKNKSIKVHGNTYRKDADSVPCRRYRDYRKDYSKNINNYIPGIMILPDRGGVIINYPEQHIENGRAKNISTNYYYKKMVRIIKKMRYIMSDLGYKEAEDVSSFGLESLLWNLPDSVFMKYSSYKYIFDEVVQYLSEHKHALESYKEANGIKPLCESSSDVEKYKNYIDRLRSFYEYV